MTTLAIGQANGSSSAVASDGGNYDIVMHGTWDGATAQVEVSVDGTNYAPAGGDDSLTEDGAIKVNPKPGLFWRVTVSGGGGSESLTIEYIHKDR